jgi:hypothetical protein
MTDQIHPFGILDDREIVALALDADASADPADGRVAGIDP